MTGGAGLFHPKGQGDDLFDWETKPFMNMKDENLKKPAPQLASSLMAGVVYLFNNLCFADHARR